MLKQLRINNIALIDACTIDFGQGLNVLTGETGAGKSIIIDSLNFVLGARADKTLIKSGCDFASVVGVFDMSDVGCSKELFELADVDPDDTLVITRKMNVAGKNECKINGQITTLGVIKKITSRLVDICGQHDSTALLDVKTHITLLDQMNSSGVEALKEVIRGLLDKYSSINRQISMLGGTGAERARNIDILKFQIDEISNAKLYEGEDEVLVQQLDKERNSERISEALSEICAMMDGDVSMAGAIKSASTMLSSLGKYDNQYVSISDRLQSVKYEMEDILDTLYTEKQNIEYSEARLNELMERLDLIKNLKRKYGSTIHDILLFLDKANEQLNTLVNAEQSIQQLMVDRSQLQVEIYDECQQLTKLRKTLADQLRAKMLTELHELGMKNAQFAVQFNDYTQQNVMDVVTDNGADQVEFLFSANLGVQCQPLSKIISGGEMSRFMLAFKCVVSSDIKTYVFDEIDTGIGGEVGTIVARKMSAIACNAQVLCVTHLAQIACFGDINFLIRKWEKDKTYTEVTLLDDNGKVEEITRMIGSVVSSEYARKHAVELIKEAQNIKTLN